MVSLCIVQSIQGSGPSGRIVSKDVLAAAAQPSVGAAAYTDIELSNMRKVSCTFAGLRDLFVFICVCVCVYFYMCMCVCVVCLCIVCVCVCVSMCVCVCVAHYSITICYCYHLTDHCHQTPAG